MLSQQLGNDEDYRGSRVDVSGCFTRCRRHLHGSRSSGGEPQDARNRSRHRPPGFHAWMGSAPCSDRASDALPASRPKWAEATRSGVLLNKLVGGGQQRFRDREAKRLGRLEVDDEFEFRR